MSRLLVWFVLAAVTIPSACPAELTFKFTVGDAGLLTHKPGDDNPNFLPPEGKLFHVPSAAKLLAQPEPGLELTCGPETCRISVLIKDQRALEYRVEATAHSALPAVAHLTLLPHLGESLQTATGRKVTLGSQPWRSCRRSWASGWRTRVGGSRCPTAPACDGRCCRIIPIARTAAPSPPKGGS